MLSDLETQTLRPDPEGIAAAADILRAGRLVALPTETVYGLGADACNSHAVAAIFAAKDRPTFNPLIVHVTDPAQAGAFVEWSDTAQDLAQAFWPGPLTLVLPLRKGHGLAPLVTAGLPTLAIRVPAHPVARALLAQFGGPVAAPSANLSGRISPTTAAHVLAGLSGRIDAVIDDGPCHVGLESTILGLSEKPMLLRPGGLPAEALEAAIGHPLARPGDAAPVNAPGQTASHYAPRCALRLNADSARAGEAMLGFGPVEADLNLSRSGDMVEAAANLFGHLHALDAQERPIAVSPVPETGLGRAINDRLRRAAAPRAP